jgi:hypothetical protein
VDVERPCRAATFLEAIDGDWRFVREGVIFEAANADAGRKRAVRLIYQTQEGIMPNVSLSKKQREEMLGTLKARFEKNMKRHTGLEWAKVLAKLEGNPEKLWSLHEMERTGGEPDVVGQEKKTGDFIFYDCSEESPKGRRSLCYDREALDSRKENKPKNSAMDMAAAMGVELLTEEQYRELQKLGEFDTKTSSWVKTPRAVRELGGALFCDRRFDTVFLYHNGAESYYAARGFRGWLRV